jgi:hypothetical protein
MINQIISKYMIILIFLNKTNNQTFHKKSTSSIIKIYMDYIEDYIGLLMRQEK